jgi:hypothetical protein
MNEHRSLTLLLLALCFIAVPGYSADIPPGRTELQVLDRAQMDLIKRVEREEKDRDIDALGAAYLKPSEAFFVVLNHRRGLGLTVDPIGHNLGKTLILARSLSDFNNISAAILSGRNVRNVGNQTTQLWYFTAFELITNLKQLQNANDAEPPSIHSEFIDHLPGFSTKNTKEPQGAVLLREKFLRLRLSCSSAGPMLVPSIKSQSDIRQWLTVLDFEAMDFDRLQGEFSEKFNDKMALEIVEKSYSTVKYQIVRLELAIKTVSHQYQQLSFEKLLLTELENDRKILSPR